MYHRRNPEAPIIHDHFAGGIVQPLVVKQPEQFYILSLKHSPSPEGHGVWWKPEACGYTTDLDKAGLFTQAQLNADKSYYDNGVTTQAWRKANAEHHARQLGRVANFNQLKIAAAATAQRNEEARQ